ncbi:MAG: NADP-dependent malic enzyme [Bdellovibrionales bacterium]|nr:NADP-dependent malic enzyme [Bdellovibrionales bacterium]
MSVYEESLEYHSSGRKGKIEVVPTKPVGTQKDLTLAYSPGVAEPCRKIAENEDLAYEYTTKGNLVAVLSNGTAVLGLGNIGAAAAKPVMEGKGILFKRFADIDVFDIELNAPNPDDVIKACMMLAPTFGGINLEDIKAPECFYIEEELKKKLKIPVFHDDQHGTAVISGAAFLNALEFVNKKIEDMKVVFCGGGAAAIACANLYVNLGVRRENIVMCDSKGVIYKGRTEGMNPYKERYAIETKKRSIAEALDGADAFVGVSVKGIVTKEMVAKMARDPIVFAMANPDPEITPEEVLSVRKDAIIATGRSDYPNQVNNVLGFPFIFRGALDTRSSAINEEMKMAAVRALAQLAKEDVPEYVSRAYGGQQFKYGREYLIPKPFDRRALLYVAPAVAEAAMKSGVARIKIDIEAYREKLQTFLGFAYTAMRHVKKQARKAERDMGRRVNLVFPEGEHHKILQAAKTVSDDNIATPVLIGNPDKIREEIKKLGLDDLLEDAILVRPSTDARLEEYARRFFEKRKRKGITVANAETLMKQPMYFGAMMVEQGHADGLIGGAVHSYPDTIKPALHCIGAAKGKTLAGIYMVVTKKKTYWFADTTINVEPTAEQLADIAVATADLVRTSTGVEPRVAMLSFSNFGSNTHPATVASRDAVRILRERNPEIIVDGEMQADTALRPDISAESFPFNQVPGDANILIFPNLHAANIGYKLVWRMGGVEAIGPILVGMNKPVCALQRGSDVNDIVNMASITAFEVYNSMTNRMPTGERKST